MLSQIKMPTYFISHGGGPWPWLEGNYRQAYNVLEKSLKELPDHLPAIPKALLVISGHWEEKKIGIMSSLAPGMIYDYGGFPEHTYHIKYSAPGDPALALQVQSLLSAAGIESELNEQRGFDHGTYTPLAVAYPKANIPIVQISMRADYNPEAHLNLGRALAPLRNEGVLIIGSGLSYHNLRLFDQRASKPSHEFDLWLQQILLQSDFKERSSKLIDWEKAPSARIAHPAEDHLLPLMVAVGAAEDEKGQLCYHEDHFFGGIAVSSFRFG